tara:strand:- start:404 stop:1201 length:798 start_codon:yes stop_codon:yes gene_type:complete
MSLLSPILALIGMSGSIYYIFTYPSPGFAGYFDKASFIFLGVMPPSVMLLSHTVRDFVVGITTLVSSLFKNHSRYQMDIIQTLSRASALVRSEGIGALLGIRQQIKYDLLRDGVSLIVNDFTIEEIRHNLTNRVNAKQSRMALAANLFENMAKLSPGVGMIGTLIGLIAMMADMKDPAKIGAGMALAMITTLYGLLLGTLLYGPAAEKITLEAEKSLENDLMVLEGVVSLKGKKSSIHMKDIMRTYGGKSTDRASPQKSSGQRKK